MQFPPILAINLANRKDRWDSLRESFEGWPPIERIDAIRASPGWKGCLQSHKKALAYAKGKAYPWVLVLEDDCIPSPDSLTRFQKLLPLLWNHRSEWDIFLGGSTSVSEASVYHYDPPLLRVKAHTAHFCLYNRNSYNKIIEALESAEVPIDEVYRTDPALRLFCTVPHLAKQRPGKSDIESTETNYTHMFDRANEELFKAVDQQLEGFLNENRTFYKKIVIADVLTVACIIAMYLFLPR